MLAAEVGGGEEFEVQAGGGASTGVAGRGEGFVNDGLLVLC